MKKAILVVLAVLVMAGCWEDDANTVFEVQGDKIVATSQITVSKSATAYTETDQPDTYGYPRVSWIVSSGDVDNNDEYENYFVEDGYATGIYFTRRGWMTFDISSLSGKEITAVSIFLYPKTYDENGIVVQGSSQSLPLPIFSAMTDEIWTGFEGAEFGRIGVGDVTLSAWNEIEFNQDGIDFINNMISSGELSLCFRSPNDYDSEPYETIGRLGMYLVGSDYEPYLEITYNSWAKVAKPAVGVFTEVTR